MKALVGSLPNDGLPSAAQGLSQEEGEAGGYTFRCPDTRLSENRNLASSCKHVWEDERESMFADPPGPVSYRAAPGSSRMPAPGAFVSPGSSARPAFSLPSHSPTPMRKEGFSLPWRRTDS